MVATMVFGIHFAGIGFICLMFPCLQLVWLVAVQPFKSRLDTFRGILNELIVSAVLAIYSYYRFTSQYGQHTDHNTAYLPETVLGLLLLAAVVNLVFMIRYRLRINDLQTELKMEDALRNETKEFIRGSYMSEAQPNIMSFGHKYREKPRRSQGAHESSTANLAEHSQENSIS